MKKFNAPTAVALSYQPKSMSAPRVSLSGHFENANKIKEQARRYGVPIHRNPRLATKLSQIELEQEIPAEFYHDVAEIFLVAGED